MAVDLHRSGFPGKAASAVNAGAAVKVNAGDVQRSFVPIGSGVSAVEPFGVVLATGPSPGAAITVLDTGNLARVVAGASLGHGAYVGVGSTNGALAPVSGASGTVVYAVGQALSAAAAGETFSVYIRPRQLSGAP